MNISFFLPSLSLSLPLVCKHFSLCRPHFLSCSPDFPLSLSPPQPPCPRGALACYCRRRHAVRGFMSGSSPHWWLDCYAMTTAMQIPAEYIQPLSPNSPDPPAPLPIITHPGYLCHSSWIAEWGTHTFVFNFQHYMHASLTANSSSSYFYPCVSVVPQ